MYFGAMPDGNAVMKYEIQKSGLRANILSYGAILQDLRFEGHKGPLVLGFEQFSHYLDHSPYFGAIVGRCANRIGDANFVINQTSYNTDKNFLEKHTLHGGRGGVGKRNWEVVNVAKDSIMLEISIQDGDMGFPGNMDVQLVYTCLEGGILDMKLTAKTDAPTLSNFAHHTYWNLDDLPTVDHHILQVDAPRYTVIDESMIPTGESLDVEGTHFDFREERAILNEEFLDHNLCLSNKKMDLRRIGHLRSAASGMKMEILSTEAGIQVYDGFKLNVEPRGLDGRKYGKNAGIALEPQGWPDAINHPDFPSVILEPDDEYFQHTQFGFSRV